MCSSFGTPSRSQCTALAAVGRCLCTVNVHFLAVSAEGWADKRPGVRSIGVGELPLKGSFPQDGL